ncbi:MAG: DinB family protein, partial [Bacteroidota bacterium]
MPSLESHRLLEELTTTVKQGMEEIQPLYDYSTTVLQQRPAGGGWSVVEVLFHLNYYADYYTKAMETAMATRPTTPSRRTSSFKSGWLGNYFTRIIGPRDEEGELPMKMQSPPGAVPPAPSQLNPQQELDQYMAHQRKLLKLLHQAHSFDLGRIR